MSDRIDLYPVLIVEDRYCGVYSGGAWVALARSDDYLAESGDASRMRFVLDGVHGGDGHAMDFWHAHGAKPWIAVGDTPDQALAALYAKNPQEADRG